MKSETVKPNQQLDEIILDTRVRLEERKYWLTRLSGDLDKSRFPFDRPNKSPGKPQIETLSWEFTGEVFSQLMRLSNKSDIRLYIILTTVLILLLAKYTGNKDIIVGSPIYRQEEERDFINRILALRNQLTDEMSFKELLLQVNQTNSEAVKHLNYPIETIPYELNMALSDNEFPLFDVAILLENIHEKSYIDYLNLNVIFSFLKAHDSIKGVVEYNADFYCKPTMERIVNHYMNLTRAALNNIASKIFAIPIFSEEEAKQLLFDFNDTGEDYPRTGTLHQLFERQVEQTPDRIAVVGKKGDWRQALTYGQLNEKSNRWARVLRDREVGVETIVAILSDRSIDLLTALLAVLKAGGAYLPIDTEYPPDRIDYLLDDSDSKCLLTNSQWVDKVKFAGTIIDMGNEALFHGKVDNARDSNPEPLSHPNNLAYCIYTSGSTGKPKGVMIRHQAVVNYVWWAAGTYVKNEKVNFPLYSSISFDLTVTSIFTPLVSGNTIVVYTGKEKDFLIEKIIEENRVGIVKLTPSHLYMIKHLSIQRSDIRCFIVGGEELETRIAREIHARFAGNVEIYNEYGPTEAAVGCVYYRFNPPEDSGWAVPIGVPINNARIYVLDPDQNPVPIGVRGEIYISGEGLARGYLNSVELTAEKFIKNPFPSPTINNRWSMTNGRLYRTGDMARWLPQGNLEYLGRVDRQVKIRGYRIETAEIEQQLQQYNAVKEAVVIARQGTEISSREEKADPYLCAYFVANERLRVPQLREYMQQNLPDYMIPLFFVPLQEIPITANGKINKKVLPKPEIKADQEYIPPRTEMENKLVQIWSEILAVEKKMIGIDTNFFELGGHSLKQMGLISQIHKEFNVKISLAEIFQIPTIRGLTEYIKGTAADKHIPINTTEQKEFYPLSSAQKRLYILHRMDPDSTAYNLPEVIPLPVEFDPGKIADTLKKLIKRHESLRTSFHMVDDMPVQVVHHEEEFEIEYYDLTTDYTEGVAPGHILDAFGAGTSLTPTPDTNTIIKEFVRPFDLSRAPLFRVGLIKQEKQENILLVDMHHVISDAISEAKLLEDFESLYSGKDIPSLRIQYRDFSEWQTSKPVKEALKLQEQYWLNRLSGEIPLLELPTDYPRPVVQSFAGRNTSFNISREESAALNNLALEEGATLFMVLMAIAAIFLSKISGQEDIIIGTPIAGRSHADLEQIIGMFVNTLAMRSYPASNDTFREFLSHLKDYTLQDFENQGYPFDELIEKLSIKRDTDRNPLFDVMFALQNAAVKKTGPVLPGDVNYPGAEDYVQENKTSKFDLSLDVVEREEFLCIFEFNTQLFKNESIRQFIINFKEIVSAVVKNKNIKLKDIAISTNFVDVESFADGYKEIDFKF